MKLALRQSSIGLERDQLIALRDAKGVRVSCLDGALWITQETIVADVVLEAGQSLIIDTPGLTLVMALRPSALRLRERVSRASPLWQALAGWLRAGLQRPSGPTEGGRAEVKSQASIARGSVGANVVRVSRPPLAAAEPHF